MITTLILPAYNEEKYISDIVTRGLKFADRVIVVDNNSSDSTYDMATKAGAIAIKHCTNLGKSGSMKTGCEAAIRLGTDLIALMDSDGQHFPEDLPKFIDAITKDNYDIVIGCRKGGDAMPFVRLIGNYALRVAVRVLFQVKIDDIQSGFRVFRAEAYEKLKWNSTGSAHYFADAEMTTKIGRSKLRYKELQIKTVYHDADKGMTPIQGLYLLTKIFFWRVGL